MHVGRDVVLPIAYNHSGKNKIVSPAYQVFKFNMNCELISEYFFLYLKSYERDRFFWFNTDGSVRDGMTWDDFINVDIELPTIEIQQKYVDIYNAMNENQRCYERGLDDLKLVCDAYTENLSKFNLQKIGNFIERNKKKNQNLYFDISSVKGLNNDGQFIKPMRLFSGDISTFKVVSKNDFVYNSRINSTIKKLSVVINESEDLIVSPAYESFNVIKDKELYPFYLYMLLQRESFARKVLFNSYGSSTIVFGYDELCDIEIPFPDFTLQVAIANLYRVYKERWTLNEKLKSQIKDICPILIKGSLDEGRKSKEV